MRWQFGAVLPEGIRLNLAEPELEFSRYGIRLNLAEPELEFSRYGIRLNLAEPDLEFFW